MSTALKLPPGPTPLPVIGNLLEIGRSDLLSVVTSQWRARGDLLRLVFGRQEVVVVAHPEHMRHVLVKRRANYIKGRAIEPLLHFTGKGLFASDGELWQVQRRTMQPHFTVSAVRAYGPAIAAAVGEVVARLARRTGPTPVDMSAELTRFAMDVICRTMFSMDIGGGAEALGDAISEAMRWVSTRGTKLVSLPLLVPTPENLRFRRALAEIDRFLLGMIAERRRSGETRGDLLDVLLAATDAETGRGMSSQQLRDELVTIFLAGHETTALALGWALYLLTQHREAQAGVCAEVDAALGGRSPTVADLGSLPATRRVVDEALRLFPPIWVNPREAVAADEIDGYAVPAGALVLMLIYATHRHPEFWRDPERFDPERFSPEGSEGRHPLAYLPFGGGSRVCIGMNLALQEMVLFLAGVLQRFEVALAPGYLFGFDPNSGTLRAKEPLRVHLKARALR